MLVSIPSGACCAGRKPPTERKNLPEKPALSACLVGLGTSMGLPSASLCRACPQPPVKPSFQPSSPTPPPIFQPLAFCGVEGFFFFPLVSFFLVLFGPQPRGKGAPGTPPSTWSFSSSSLTKWKIEHLTVLLPGWWGYLLFHFVGEDGGRHSGFANASGKLRRRKYFLLPASVFSEVDYPTSRYVGSPLGNAF